MRRRDCTIVVGIFNATDIALEPQAPCLHGRGRVRITNNLSTAMKVFSMRHFMLVALCSCSGWLFAAPVHILPLGDSITQGGRNDREEYTYRYPLFCMLVDDNVDFDFIGSLKTGLHPDATWPTYKDRAFDSDHEGHYGWKTAAVRDNLAAWMKTYPASPDIALIHLGTNDQKTDDIEKSIVAPLTDIIAMLRKANPHVIVLVGHLNFNGGAALKIRPAVEAMAQSLTTPDSPIVTVAHYDGFIADPSAKDTDTFDWAHPNPRGQRKMAEKWYAAMRPYLSRFHVRPSADVNATTNAVLKQP